MKNQKAFTLVELIVVITILAILGTIAFISLQGYSASARNSKRISDIANIKTSLALFNTKTGRYPDPDNITDVIYKGAMVWSQGEVGEGVTRNLSKNLPKTPLDPLLEQPYVYSLLNTKKEYEVGCIFETDPNNLTIGIGNQTNAANKRYYAYIKGDYNGKVAKVSTGSQLYVFAVPSIIGSNLSDPDIEEIIRKKELVYNGYQNIPANYSGNDITMTGSFEFGGDSINIVVYSGSIENLSQSYEALQTFGTNLQNAYSGSILANDSSYKDITLMNLDDSDSIRQIAGSIVKENLGGEIAPAVECADKPSYTHTSFVSGNVLIDGTTRQKTTPGNPCYYECTDGYHGNQCEIAPVCATRPSYSNTNFIDGTVLIDGTTRQNAVPSAPCYYECTGGFTGTQCNIGTCAAQTHGTTNTSYVTGNPTTIGIARQTTNTGLPCYYTCINGYTGTNCDVPPLVTQLDCTSAGWFRVNSTNDVYIGTSKGNGFCISPRIGGISIPSSQLSWNGRGDVDNSAWDASSTSIRDSGNPHPEYGQTRTLETPSLYSCKALGTATTHFITSDTIYGRMKRITNNRTNLGHDSYNIDWILNETPPGHVLPSLFIADCIDGVKDLKTTMTYTHINNTTESITYSLYNQNISLNTDSAYKSDVTYQNRQKYLLAWTQKKGSHIPSAYSYITSGYSSANDSDGNFLTGNQRGELQVACEAGLLTDSNTGIGGTFLASIGRISGDVFGRYARQMVDSSCNDQNSYNRTGGPDYTRFIIRP